MKSPISRYGSSERGSQLRLQHCQGFGPSNAVQPCWTPACCLCCDLQFKQQAGRGSCWSPLRQLKARACQGVRRWLHSEEGLCLLEHLPRQWHTCLLAVRAGHNPKHCRCRLFARTNRLSPIVQEPAAVQQSTYFSFTVEQEGVPQSATSADWLKLPAY